MCNIAYRKVSSSDAAPQGSVSQTTPIRDGIHQSADALIDDTSQNLIGLSIQKKPSPSNPIPSEPGVAGQENINIPLSSQLKVKGTGWHARQPSNSSRTVLAAKATNLKMPSKGSHKFSRSKISQPALQVSTSRSTDEVIQALPNKVNSIGALQDAPPSNKMATSSDATDLSKKLSALMQHGARYNDNGAPESKTVITPRASQDRKLSPLQKSKGVFARAKRALSDRLSSSVEKSQRKKDNESNSSLDELAGPEYKKDEETNGRRVNRRIAEGVNLGNPKIRSLTGDGNIPRKPLPVYESMKSLRRYSDSFEDPFSDNTRLNDSKILSEQTQADFDYEGRRRSKRASAQEPLLSRIPSDFSYEATSSPPQIVSKPSSRFSGLMSGLTQHSATETFSSSPVGYSTPQTRPEPRASIGGRKKLTVVARGPSMLDFSFEEESEDNHEDNQLAKCDELSPSLSLKRKTGKANLRSNSSPALKKVKKSFNSLDLAALSSGLPAMYEGEGNGNGNIKDTLKRIRRATALGPISKGFKIFDPSKGKEPARKEMEIVKKTRGRSMNEKHPLTSQYGSRDLGSKRRVKGAISGGFTDKRSLSIDELQMDV